MKTNISILVCLLVIFIVGCSSTPTIDPNTDSSLSDIKERGKLTVAMDVPYGVMEFFDDNGKIVGFEADLAREIAGVLGVEAELIDTEWDDIFINVKAGTVDIAISSMTITPERSAEMLFSDPYFNAGQTIIILEETADVDLESLAGKKLGAQLETTSLDEAKSIAGDEALAIPYDNYESQIISDLESGEIDAIVADYIAAASVVKDNPGLKIAIDPFTQEFYGIPTKLGNTALNTEINSILREFKRNGKLDELKAKWIN
jgi:ABC-type amino acid transport substrate-binding protein